MMDSMDWLVSKFNELNVSYDRQSEILGEICSALVHLDYDGKVSLARGNLMPIIAFIRPEKDESDIASEIAATLFGALPPQDVLSTYGNVFQQAFDHPSLKVKANILSVILKWSLDENFPTLAVNHPELLAGILKSLADPERAVAEGSVNILKNVGKTTRGVELLFSDAFLPLLKKIMLLNSTTNFRVYEIVVTIAAESLGGLEAGHDSGILPSLLTEIKSSDCLSQLNALELISDLAKSQFGYLYLQREGFVNFLINFVDEIKNLPILLPGVIDFFGRMSINQPEIFVQQHPEVIQLLFDMFENAENAFIGVEISAIGKISSSDAGKRVMLTTYRSKLMHFLERLGDMMNHKNDVFCLVMDTLCILLDSKNPSLDEAMVSCFNALGPQALPNIVSAAKLPFTDIRLASLQLLGVISRQNWGALLLLNSPGLIEFLLNRDIEFDKDCKVAKYEVVKSLTVNPSFRVASHTLAKMKLHVKEGPFYISTDLQTAVEQES